MAVIMHKVAGSKCDFVHDHGREFTEQVVGVYCGRCGGPVLDQSQVGDQSQAGEQSRVEDEKRAGESQTGDENQALVDHSGCERALVLEPPRYCAQCRRRLIVQVLPTGWDRALLPARRTAMTALSPSELRQYDADHVWHPYAPSGSTARVVESAEGVRLRLAATDGEPARDVIDGMSSWWAAIHGYRNPVLDAALTEQAGRMSHVMFGGLTHAPAVELTRRLLDLAPGAGTEQAMRRVFLCDSGSVSVEVAIKLCLQYHRGRKAPQRIVS